MHTIQHPSVIAYNNLNAAPKMVSVFTTAFTAVLTDNRLLAEDIFAENIGGYRFAIEYRYAVAKFTGPWWQPFNCPVRHGKLGVLACRGDLKAIERLYKRGESTGIQIAHALIECSLDPVPNLAFKISANEKIALLQTYLLETEVFSFSNHAFYPSLAWFKNRTTRAVRFMNEYGKLCSGDRGSAASAKAAHTSKPEAKVNWPDRLYDGEEEVALTTVEN